MVKKIKVLNLHNSRKLANYWNNYDFPGGQLDMTHIVVENISMSQSQNEEKKLKNVDCRNVVFLLYTVLVGSLFEKTSTLNELNLHWSRTN